MLRGWAVVGIVVLVQSASATSHLELTADAFTSDAGIALVRWTGGDEGSFRVEAARLSGSLTDQAIEDRSTLLGPLSENVTGQPRTTTTDLPDGHRITSTVTRDTTLVVLPLDGPYRAQATSTRGAADVLLRPVEHEVLEPDRRMSDDPDDVTTAGARYEVRDVVTAGTGDPARVRVVGDFLLYVWDADFLYEGDGMGRVYRTGQWSEQGSMWSQKTEHNVHAVVVVRDGSLEVEAPAGTSLYDEVILLEGVGSVRVAGGASRQPPSDPILATMPASGSGVPRVVLSAAPATVPPASPALGGAGVPASLLLVAGVGVAAVPHLLGRRAARWGAGPWANLCATRSRGFVRLALAAERRHRFAAAAWWMGRGARWGQDPELRMQQAIFLRMAGRPARALRRHREAEEMFRMDGCASALNGYEAARAAALVGRVDEAFTWLLSAVREEPWLAQRAPFEPDLAPLRSLPAFMDVSQAADPDGYLLP